MTRRVCGVVTALGRWTMRRRLTVLILVASLFLIYVSFGVHTALPWTVGKGTADRFSHLVDDKDHHIPPVPAVTKIILMTYGRSGSTFTSDVLRQDPRIFYTFEPLYNLLRRTLDKSHNVQRLFARAAEDTRAAFDQSSLELMEIFLTCGFEALNVTDINNYQLRNSQDSRLLWGCIQKPKDGWTPQTIVNCFLESRKICLSHPIKMVKTIRFRGTAARRMLSRHEDLKILYLIRDPRGTLTSQQQVFGAFKWPDVANASADFCRIFREDLSAVGQMLEEFPQRVKILRYETLATYPLEVSEDLYAFFGLRYTQGVKEFVYNRTMAGLQRNHAYGTLRSNSSKAAYFWRTKISLRAARVIDENCRDLYQTLGYLPVSSERELMDIDGYSLKKAVVFHGYPL